MFALQLLPCSIPPSDDCWDFVYTGLLIIIAFSEGVVDQVSACLPVQSRY